MIAWARGRSLISLRSWLSFLSSGIVAQVSCRQLKSPMIVMCLYACMASFSLSIMALYSAVVSDGDRYIPMYADVSVCTPAQWTPSPIGVAHARWPRSLTYVTTP